MHKGLYWSQLVTGIGVGFIVSALIWISTDQLELDALLLNQGDTSVSQIEPAILPERQIVFYDSTELDLSSTRLVFPEDLIGGTSLVDSVDNESGSEVETDANPEKKDETVNTEIMEKTETGESVSSPIEPDLLPAASVAKDAKSIVFVINPGDTAEEIAIRLEKLDLVNGREFLHLVHLKNLDRKLKTGHYVLKKGEMVSTIIAKFIR